MAAFDIAPGGLGYIFIDRSVGAFFYNWNFGDGNTSTLQNYLDIIYTLFKKYYEDVYSNSTDINDVKIMDVDMGMIKQQNHIDCGVYVVELIVELFPIIIPSSIIPLQLSSARL